MMPGKDPFRGGTAKAIATADEEDAHDPNLAIEEESREFSPKHFRPSELAFPDGQDAPPQFAEIPSVARIARDVRFELCGPEADVRLGCGRTLASGVTMPEATMDEDHRSMPWEHDVGGAGKIAAANSEAKAHAVQEGTHHELGLRVPSADAGHEGGAVVGFESVGQADPTLVDGWLDTLQG